MRRKNFILTVLMFLFVNILSMAIESTNFIMPNTNMSSSSTNFQEALKDYKPNLENIDKIFNYIEKNIKELENQLLSKIGNFSIRKKDAIQYEKVHRYLYLVRLLYELKERLKQDGLVITVHNGQQRFQKANSLIKEINTTSNQLLAIERSFDFEVENSPVEKKPPSDGSDLL